MKNAILIALFFVGFNASFAQQYQFKEGFEGILNGQLPNGWSGDIPVLSYHGVNDEKGLAALLNSSDVEDSVTTPLIGTIKSSTVLVFYYRWVLDFIYPSDTRNPNSKDKLEVFASTDGTQFSLIHKIDSFNHKPTLNFRRVEVPLGTFAGNNIQLKFKCTWGGGRYFQDIDSVLVQDGVSSVEEMEHENETLLYPNPATEEINISFRNCKEKQFFIYDFSGNLVYADKANCTSSINITDLNSGIYFLKTSRETKKFVVLKP